jgi:sulfate adenylyltransferase
MISPHGGRLVNRVAEEGPRRALLERAGSLPAVTLNARELSDLEMIAIGALSPLEGFMTRDEYESVVDAMRLPQGLPWTIPVTLAAKTAQDAALPVGEDVALRDPDGRVIALLSLRDAFPVDKRHEAQMVLLTDDAEHPGVQYLQSVGDVYLGGPITLLSRPRHTAFQSYRLDPKETRVLFKLKGWRTVAAFQTRNPIHRAHEYIQKCALEIVDGLLIHPLMGETKGDDIPAEVRMRCYEALLANYYHPQHVALSVFPAAMRYAGPREAIFHALVRKNYGCTHFIVGRDHAGVGSYYGPYDAQRIFDDFDPQQIGITPLFFDHAFHCKRCGNMASIKTCPHGPEDHVVLSGTKVREMLARGERPPTEFTRPEVADVLLAWYAEQREGAQ